MKTLAYAPLVVAIAFSPSAMAMQHSTVIEHAAGAITADYQGTTRVAMKQIGSAGSAGRTSSLRCQWSVSLSVERQAQVGASLQARRTMIRKDVLTGSSPGWCSERGSGIDRAVEARRDDLHRAMLAMVTQDRDVILVEAEGAYARKREG